MAEVLFKGLSGNALVKAQKLMDAALAFGMLRKGAEVDIETQHDVWCVACLDPRRDCNCDPDIRLTPVCLPPGSQMVN